MITLFKEKRVLLDVTGSIACYKVVDLASKLTQEGALVDVIMTQAAERFVTPLAFQSVTGRRVYKNMWDEHEHVQHVTLGEAANVMLIAPATANTMAKLAQGVADTLLTLTALSIRCPLIVAPAMDGGMYAHPATQANVAILRERGTIFAGPEEGRMASGLTGKGRMQEPEVLLAQVRLALARRGGLVGKKVVVTTGPTRESLDPVRFITNHSTGKQGLALAQAALDEGASVTIIAGPIAEKMPLGAEVILVTTTQEMHDATVASLAETDVLLMVAAVSDFRPSTINDHKIKKTDQVWGMAIGLERTLDILQAVKQYREEFGYPQIVLGFAAETRDAFEYGRAKLQRKGLDYIAINDVTAAGAGFAVNTNRVTLLNREGEMEKFPLQSKAAVAEKIIGRVRQALKAVS